MSANASWSERNDAFLGAALDWLRLRLNRAAGTSGAGVATDVPAVDVVAAPAPKWGFGRRPAATPMSSTPAPRLPAPDVDAALDEAARRMDEAWASEPPPALRLLCTRLGLSTFERDVLLLCAGLEFDTRTAALCARAQDDPARPYPTFALALSLFDEPAWDALAPDGPLRHWRLIEINQPGAVPLTASALRADERIVNFIKGLNHLDDRLAPLLVPMEAPDPDALPPSQQRALQRIVQASRRGRQAATVVLLQGRDRESNRQVAAAAAAALGLQAHRLSADALPAHPGEIESLARLWQRESLLLPLALVIDARDTESGAADGPLQRLARFAARTGGLVMVDARAAPGLAIEPVAVVEVDKPEPAEQRVAWEAALGDKAGNWPPRLAGQFNLNLHDIATVAAEARREATTPDVFDERLWQGCLARTRPALDRLAEKIDAKAGWEQLVLPAAEVLLLRRLAAQVGARTQVYDDWGFRGVMNRGLGISALFAGESGTGKTMAAEVLAREMRLDLYRIDLSAVVSKYIGETEKNLRQVFDAAEDGGAILLFDEADALFGKRSEVKDSHDRYANIEINYLLQRMEAYRGLAILATNMKSALDPAFVRRLRFIVNFPFPAPAERRRIWERVFPPGVPLGVLDYDRLARLNLTGGNIHGIAVGAAFLAAQAGTPVTMELLFDAGRAEMRKLEHPINEAEFRLGEPMEVAR